MDDHDSPQGAHFWPARRWPTAEEPARCRSTRCGILRTFGEAKAGPHPDRTKPVKNLDCDRRAFQDVYVSHRSGADASSRCGYGAG